MKTYERLEIELDTAVLTAGAGGDVANELAQLGGSVPTQPQRRVQQSISLAQRLLKVRRATWLRAVDWLKPTHSLARASVPSRGGITEAATAQA